MADIGVAVVGGMKIGSSMEIRRVWMEMNISNKYQLTDWARAVSPISRNVGRHQRAMMGLAPPSIGTSGFSCPALVWLSLAGPFSISSSWANAWCLGGGAWTVLSGCSPRRAAGPEEWLCLCPAPAWTCQHPVELINAGCVVRGRDFFILNQRKSIL